MAVGRVTIGGPGGVALVIGEQFTTAKPIYSPKSGWQSSVRAQFIICRVCLWLIKGAITLTPWHPRQARAAESLGQQGSAAIARQATLVI
jgi:hypothetical protein